MMSPLSVSQYINPEKIKFDAVIFDEASQIMPEDAVPCLLRSKQAIVIGDTQQLPPTSFFMKDVEDEDAEEEIENLESFLSECKSRFPTKSLLWHYRSKNERLIAFSNEHLYENKLITFPNPKKTENATLELKHVKNATYDRGKTRTNKDEAKEVIKTYHQTTKKHPNKSIGIITLNNAQEKAIRKEFENSNIDANENIDPHSENLFIKNLETVQGDERDVIILSIGYGKNPKGTLSYNFGPINKQGGHKRLNVAITRSRHKTIIITSINPKELKDAKLNAHGPKLLKKYLNYAKRKNHHPTQKTKQNPNFNTPFEESVYNELKKQKLKVVSQIGNSKYKIDMAIKHPKNKGEYVLGIECDGTQNHPTKFARDKDKIRRQALEELGWNIHRIWSDDWTKNKEREIELIKNKLKKTLNATQRNQ